MVIILQLEYVPKVFQLTCLFRDILCFFFFSDKLQICCHVSSVKIGR